MGHVKIFITGHKGYIGSRLYDKLSEKKCFELVGYDLVDNDDILDKDKLYKVMRNFSPDIVIHLAALSSVSSCNDNEKKALNYNVIGTKNVIDAMNLCGCKKIIYTSTSAVYDDFIPYKETSKISPQSIYATTKLLGEHILVNNFYKTKYSYLIYRLFNVVGYESKGSTNDRLFLALKSGSVTIYGNNYKTFDGTCKRDYISLDDVIESLIKGIDLLLTKKYREVINICTSRSYTVENIINIWNEESMKNKILPYVKKRYGDRRAGDVDEIRGCNIKALKLLRWTPKQTIFDIIKNYTISD